MKNLETSKLVCKPVTPARWQDLVLLFEAQSAPGQCWCMWWRLKRKEFEQESSSSRKQALKNIVDSGQIPGLLYYQDEIPVAWCSLGPRENYPVLNRSPVFKPVDQNKVWSIVCFFIARSYRKQGLIYPVLHLAVDYALENGANIVEAYPVDTSTKKYDNASLFTGIQKVYEKIGFIEVIRRSPQRPILRLTAQKQQENFFR